MTDQAPTRPPYHKISTDEAMELMDLFHISDKGMAAIREILDNEPQTPTTGKLFRYGNPDSKVAELEERFAEKMGCRYALGVNSGTSALIAAMIAVGVGPGDEVIVPAYTFFASASAVVVAKGLPVITEIDESLTLDPAAVEANITPRTRAILAVHMVGHPAKMDALREIADRHNVALLEDVAQATGGSYKGRRLGVWGDMGCFSFDFFKVMATGEGGMVTIDDEWLYTRAQSYHDTAACWRPQRYARERKEGELFCGENYRMPEMAGAIGLAQLRQLDDRNRKTRESWRQIREETELPDGLEWIEPNDPDGVCGYGLGMLAADRDLAAKLAASDLELRGLVGGGSREARDWHLYRFWEHIHEQKTPTEKGCPFKCPLAGNVPDYRPGMCPRTEDIVYRTLFMNILPTQGRDYNSWVARSLTEGLRKVVG